MDDSAISADPPLTPTADRPSPAVAGLPGLRLWFGVFLTWVIGLFVVVLLMSRRHETGDATALALWILALTGFYMSLCNALVPLPTAWIILLAASDEVMLFDSIPLRIAAVTVLGATATMMANLNEYHVLGYFFQARVGERIRRTQAYRWAIRWFEAAPFQTLALFAFIPIPVDFVRWLAILRRYPRWRFAAANWLGRLPRYALLAGVAVALRLSAWEIALIQVALVLVLGAQLIWVAARRAGGAVQSEPAARAHEQTPST